MLDFRITLEARNPARRCWRQYCVEAGTDLFGVWVVEISYGRIGTTGRSRCFVVRDEGEARHLARSKGSYSLPRPTDMIQKSGFRSHESGTARNAISFRFGSERGEGEGPRA